MSDLKSQARELRSALDAKRSEAAQKWAEFDALRKSAVAEGVDFAKNQEAFDKLDAAGKSYDTVREEIAAGESKWARLMEIAGENAPEGGRKAADRPASSLGEMFTKSDAYASVKSRLGGAGAVGSTESVALTDRVGAKALIAVTTGSALDAGLPQPDRTGMYVGTPLAPLSLLDLINIGATDSDLVEWIEESLYTNAAVETAEGDASPESALEWVTKSTGVKDITHFIPFTRRAAADVAFVESQVNSKLVDGVRRRLQEQIIGGGGTGEDLKGIYNTTGIGEVDRSTTGLNLEDSLHSCITSIRTNSFNEPTFIGIHPEDYETFRLRKELGGVYLNGGAAVGGPMTMWGIPLVVHTGFTSGTPLVGVGRDAQLWIREGLSISASDSHEDYFTKKKVAVMASMRAAFAVTQPKSFAVSVA